jgi:hypothetical protein
MTAPTADTTLTVRVPRAWVGRVTASYVRESIRRFLAHPVKLPQYQGSLDARVSWRLPEEDLQRIGLGGDRGEMVRRIVVAELHSAGDSHLPVQRPVPAQPKDTDIVSEELIGEDASGCVIIMQRDRRGFGYQRILPIDRETYLKARHA